MLKGKKHHTTKTRDGRSPHNDDKNAYEVGRKITGATTPINLTNHKRSPLK